MSRTPPPSAAPSDKKENQFLNILLNVAIPSVIMMKLSGEEFLGPVWGLIIGLAFPLAYGIYDMVTRHKVNFFSCLGIVSLLVTGGFGIFKLPTEWMVIKEGVFPIGIGLLILISQQTRFPLVVLFFREIFDLPALQAALVKAHHPKLLHTQLARAAYALSATFCIAGVLHFSLARVILVSPIGTPEFTAQVGRMTALAFPIVALPVMVLTIGIVYYLIHSVQKAAGIDVTEMLR